MAVIQEYAQKTEIPVIEIPFEMPFREILNTIMEHIFSEEVIRLKYFKTTHDNFTALSLSLFHGKWSAAYCRHFVKTDWKPGGIV